MKNHLEKPYDIEGGFAEKFIILEVHVIDPFSIERSIVIEKSIKNYKILLIFLMLLYCQKY